MNIKTIKKNISNKMEEWLKTITDEGLRKEVKENLLVSGGCITSLFLGKNVSDYDVYIKDINVLIRLARYYAKGYEVVVWDGRERNHLIQKFLDNSRKGQSIDDINYKDCAEAISLRNLKEDQVKLWFPSEKAGLPIDCSDVKEGSYLPKYFSPNAISLTDNLQIVTRFHGDAQKIHETFDFIHATNYFTFEDGVVTNKEALESILTMQLKYRGSMYPITSVVRMRKFIKRGWNIGAGEILKMAMQISELDLKNPDVLEDQIIGVDVAYFGAIINILRNVPPSKFTTEYICSIIDRVFDGDNEQTEEEN